MTDEGRDRAIAAIWKGIERLAGAIERLSDRLVVQAKSGEIPQRAETPEQPPLPGMPEEDWQPPEIEVKPREWGNSVIIYKALWMEYGSCRTITFEDILEDCSRKLCERTQGKVGISTLPRILSALVAAGAAQRVGRKGYIIMKPTDELCEAVERARSKRAAAKEVAHG